MPVFQVSSLVSLAPPLTICRGLFAKCVFALHRPVLLELRSKPECQKPPEDWDLSHSRYALCFRLTLRQILCDNEGGTIS